VIRSPDGAFLKFAEGMFKTRAAKGRKANAGVGAGQPPASYEAIKVSGSL
jgi:hypothetical protein